MPRPRRVIKAGDDVREGLGIDGQLEAGTAGFVGQRNELPAHQLIELIRVDADFFQGRAALGVLIETASN